MEEFLRQITSVQSILFITGAGLSADSGLPTYRGVGGLYEGMLTDEGLPIEVALAGETLARRPDITWKYLGHIAAACRAASFNAGHAAIAALEEKIPRVWVLTQNIDGFHTAAGSRNVIEIHGNMNRLRCDACGWRGIIKDYTAVELPPACEACQKTARPDVVFFGEMLADDAYAIYEEQLRQGFDMYVWVGTTSIFPYIQRPLYDARRRGGVTVEINPGTTEISDEVTIKIKARAIEVLPHMARAF